MDAAVAPHVGLSVASRIASWRVCASGCGLEATRPGRRHLPITLTSGEPASSSQMRIEPESTEVIETGRPRTLPGWRGPCGPALLLAQFGSARL